MEIGKAREIEYSAFVTAWTASLSNGPWNKDRRMKTSCSGFFKRSNEVLMAFSTDSWWSSRTAYGSFSRISMRVSSE